MHPLSKAVSVLRLIQSVDQNWLDSSELLKTNTVTSFGNVDEELKLSEQVKIKADCLMAIMVSSMQHDHLLFIKRKEGIT